jgi:hypothetical protein
VESWGFRKGQWSHRVSGKYRGVTGFQENSEVADFEENYSGVMRFQESTAESRIFRKV